MVTVSLKFLYSNGFQCPVVPVRSGGEKNNSRVWFSSITAASSENCTLTISLLSVNQIGYHVYKFLLAKAAFICMMITKAQFFGPTCIASCH